MKDVRCLLGFHRWQRRHFADSERTIELGDLFFFLCAPGFRALDVFTQPVLEGGQDLVVPLEILLTLLIIVQPESSVNTDEDED